MIHSGAPSSFTSKEEECTPGAPTKTGAAGNTSTRCRWRSSRIRCCWSSGTRSRHCCWYHRACCTCFPESSVGDGAQALQTARTVGAAGGALAQGHLGVLTARHVDGDSLRAQENIHTELCHSAQGKL
jgi:hypothetical protein